jgi:hypothetical protein
MTRYGWRDTTEQSKRIELSWLRKHDYLNGYRGGNISWSRSGEPTGNINIQVSTYPDNPNIKFIYKVRKHGGEEEWRDIDFSFRMESTPCRFGGKRWVFICGLYKNGQYCGKRVRILYQVGDYFGCRHCADLTYDSCNESKRFRHGMWKIFTNESKAEDYYKKYVKREYYRGKPTKKYKRYLAISNNLSDRDLYEMEKQLLAIKK